MKINPTRTPAQPKLKHISQGLRNFKQGGEIIRGVAISFIVVYHQGAKDDTSILQLKVKIYISPKELFCNVLIDRTHPAHTLSQFNFIFLVSVTGQKPRV